MKTLNELYTEVAASNALKAEFLELKTPEDIVAFAKKNGCDATLDDIKAFFEEKRKATGELSETDLEQVAGGKSVNLAEAFYSCLTVGVGCAAAAAYSAAFGKSGTAIKGKGMLCTAKDWVDSDGSDDSNIARFGDQIVKDFSRL